MVNIREIYNFIDKLAPFSYTDKFDNTGLLVGDYEKNVSRILLALDITNDVADEANERNCDLVVSHHPIIFHPLKRLDSGNPVYRLASKGISAICAHTNLDMAENGVSDRMADLLGLEGEREVFETIYSKPYLQVVVFVPVDNADEVYKAMSAAGAGELGNYKGCAFGSNGNGRFMPMDGANPYIGEVGKIESTDETRLEMLVKPSRLGGVLKAMAEAHPYEEPAYQVIENHAVYENIGYGRIYRLEEAISTDTLLSMVKKAFGCTVVRYTDSGKLIQKVALMSGSGGSSYELAAAKGIDAYITGDVKHDQWIGASNIGLTMLDAGHFHTENIILEYLLEKIKLQFPEIDIEIAKSNKDVVKYSV